MVEYAFSQLPAAELTPFEVGQVDSEYVEIDPDSMEALSQETQEYARPQWKFDRIITTLAELKEVVQDLEKQSVISVDTETAIAAEKKAAFREAGLEAKGDLSERLCLIQIGYPHQERTQIETADGESVEGLKVCPEKGGRNYLISVTQLALEAERLSAEKGDQEVNPLEPLKNLLSDPNRTLLIQNASFEFRQFRKYGITINGVDDTMTLARSFRHDLPAVNLAALALEICGISMDKEEQKSEWDEWPLSEAQIRYALLDTELTYKVWETIMSYYERAERECRQLLESESIDLMIRELEDLSWQRMKLLEDAGIFNEDLQLQAQARAYQNTLKREMLPRLFMELQEQQGENFDPAEGYYYRGPCGSAFCRFAKIKSFDLERLAEIDPGLPKEVQRPHTTKAAIKEAVAALKEQGFSGKLSVSRIWNDIRKEPQKQSLPSKLKLELANVPEEPDLDQLAAGIEIPEEWGVGELLQKTMEAQLSRARIRRLSGVANELGLINLKERIIKQAVLERLVEENRDADGSIALEASQGNSCGVASYKMQRRKEIDYQLFEDRYSEVYQLAVTKNVSKSAVDQALKAREYDPQSRKMLIEELFIETEQLSQNPEVRIHPAYGRYYKGAEDEKDLIEKDSFLDAA